MSTEASQKGGTQSLLAIRIRRQAALATGRRNESGRGFA
jgi:hypothetical protein